MVCRDRGRGPSALHQHQRHLDGLVVAAPDGLRNQSRALHSSHRPSFAMAAVNDTIMADAPGAPQNPHDFSELLQTPHSDAFAFSEEELLALELCDQLRELELQRSLLQAQNEGTSSGHVLIQSFQG